MDSDQQKGARRTSDEIRWASVVVDGVAVERVQTRQRCLDCPKGARNRITHSLISNGLAMASGCEWHAFEQLRRMQQVVEARQQKGLEG